MSLYSFVVPIGITTLVLMLITGFLGLRTKILQTKTRLLVHKIFALTTICLAMFHAGIVIYFNFVQ